jgi:hypothetical protein
MRSAEVKSGKRQEVRYASVRAEQRVSAFLCHLLSLRSPLSRPGCDLLLPKPVKQWTLPQNARNLANVGLEPVGRRLDDTIDVLFALTVEIRTKAPHCSTLNRRRHRRSWKHWGAVEPPLQLWDGHCLTLNAH